MADQPLIDISPENWRIVQETLQRHVPDREVWAFGSRAKWTAKEYSDLDIAVIGDEPLSLGVMAELNEAFQESALPFKVDVVDWAAIRPTFRTVVEKDRVVLATPSHHKVLALSDIAEVVMGRSPSGDMCNSLGDGVPLLNGPTEFGLHHPTPVQHTTDAKKLAKVGDLLFCVRGSTTGLMNWADQPYAIGRELAAIRGKAGYPNAYVKAVIQHQLDELLTIATGATFPNVSRHMICAIKAPSISPQQATEIAKIFETIDGKILLLRETSASLEAIAQSLFKSWFVDFDPVRAKAEGREPEGVPPGIAELFPGEFDDSEIGEIPKGWKACRLDEVCEINPARRVSKGIQAPYLEMSALPTQGHRPETPVVREFSSGTKFINGDTLLARVTPCLENGKTAYVDCLRDGETGWGSTEYIVLRPKKELPTYWAYLISRHEPFRQFAIQAMVGTSGRRRVEVSRLAQYVVAVPNSDIVRAFASAIEPIQQRIAANDDSAKSLSMIRDALLPKLMSGKLRVEATNA